MNECPCVYEDEACFDCFAEALDAHYGIVPEPRLRAVVDIDTGGLL